MKNTANNPKSPKCGSIANPNSQENTECASVIGDTKAKDSRQDIDAPLVTESSQTLKADRDTASNNLSSTKSVSNSDPQSISQMPPDLPDLTPQQQAHIAKNFLEAGYRYVADELDGRLNPDNPIQKLDRYAGKSPSSLKTAANHLNHALRESCQSYGFLPEEIGLELIGVKQTAKQQSPELPFG